MEIMLYIILIIIIVILALLFWFTYVVFKENFTQDYTLESADINQKTNYGLERCKVLDLNPQEVDPKDFIMVQEFIQSNRIKEWKPINNNLKTSSNEYCYFYDDPQNDIQDNMMKGDNCDINKPIFKDNPMIKKVFHDIQPDNTHLYPVKKCVIEMDKSNRNTLNLTKFFGALSDEYCTGLAADMTSNLTDIQKRYNELTRLNSSLEFNQAFLRDKYNDEVKSFKTCKDNDARTLNLITTFTDSNKKILKNIDSTKKDTSTCKEQLGYYWENTSNNVRTLKSYIDNFDNMKKVESEQYTFCENELNDANNDIFKNKNNAFLDFGTNLNTFVSNSNLYKSNVECDTQKQNVIKSADEYLRQWTKCLPNYDKYNTCSKDLIQCNKDLDKCSSERIKYNMDNDEYTMLHKICLSNERNYVENIEKCVFEKVIVTDIQTENTNTIFNQRPVITKLVEDNKVCNTELKRKIAIKDELIKRRDDLINKKNEFKDCFGIEFEKQVLDAEAKQKADAIMVTIPNECGYEKPTKENATI